MWKEGHNRQRVKEVMGLTCSPCPKCKVVIDGQFFPTVKSITGVKKKRGGGTVKNPSFTFREGICRTWVAEAQLAMH